MRVISRAMIKLILKGLLFGIGFIISIAIALLIANKYFEGDIAERNKQLREFRALSDHDKIRGAEKIFIISYEDSSTKKRTASIKKILTKNKNAVRNFREGESYPKSDYYPLSDLENRSATVLVFISEKDGAPAATWHVYNDVIPGLGNMPLELFIETFNE
jgi:hypothetical protein